MQQLRVILRIRECPIADDELHYVFPAALQLLVAQVPDEQVQQLEHLIIYALIPHLILKARVYQPGHVVLVYQHEELLQKRAVHAGDVVLQVPAVALEVVEVCLRVEHVRAD